MVEAAGIEPASKEEVFKEPTCVVSVLISDGEAPTDRFSATHAYKGFALPYRCPEGLSRLDYTMSDLKQEESPDDVAALGG